MFDCFDVLVELCELAGGEFRLADVGVGTGGDGAGPSIIGVFGDLPCGIS